ncbi:MAG: FIST N-terminal domain-containing protein, partial [Candidatus Sedimenticola sp. 6PFRAG5]
MQVSLHRFNAETGWDNPLNGEMDSSQTLVIVFSDPRPNTALKTELSGLHRKYPESILIGCSSSGEIYGEDLSDESLVVGVLRFQDTHLKLAHVPINDADESEAVGQMLAEQLAADDLTAVFTLTDGLLVNGSAYIQSLDSALPKGVIVTGGLAGDGDRFEKTWLLYDGETLTGQVAAVGLYGNSVHVAHGSRGGWDLLGPEREVTRAEGNVLYSLDG